MLVLQGQLCRVMKVEGGGGNPELKAKGEITLFHPSSSPTLRLTLAYFKFAYVAVRNAYTDRQHKETKRREEEADGGNKRRNKGRICREEERGGRKEGRRGGEKKKRGE